MFVSIFLFILSTIAFIICCCKGNIMQCLRKSGYRKPNPNKPTRLFARHQQEVKEQCKTIGKDVNKIWSELSVAYNAIPRIPQPRHPLPPPHARDSKLAEAEISDSLMNIQEQLRGPINPDYEEFNPPKLNRTANKLHAEQHKSQSTLMKHQAEADKAYRRSDIIFVWKIQ